MCTIIQFYPGVGKLKIRDECCEFRKERSQPFPTFEILLTGGPARPNGKGWKKFSLSQLCIIQC